jgi:hypothetical protein
MAHFYEPMAGLGCLVDQKNLRAKFSEIRPLLIER